MVLFIFKPLPITKAVAIAPTGMFDGIFHLRMKQDIYISVCLPAT